MKLVQYTGDDVKDVLVTENFTIREAAERLEKTGMTCLLVARQSVIIGLVSDSDIRRGLINGCSAHDKIKQVMNERFVYSNSGYSNEWYIHFMEQKGVNVLPVFQNNALVSIYRIIPVAEKHSIAEPILFMAGGRGERLWPLTKDTPKPMLKVKGVPILQRLVEQAVSEGFQDIFISTHYLAEVIEDYFGDGEQFGCQINYLREERPLGTGGALTLLRPYLKTDNFMVVNGDILYQSDFKTLLDKHLAADYLVTMGVKQETINCRYGVIDVDGNEIRSIQEKPNFDVLVNAGIYCFNHKIFDFIDIDSRIDATDLVKNLMAAGNRCNTAKIEQEWMDIGVTSDYNQAQTVEI